MACEATCYTRGPLRRHPGRRGNIPPPMLGFHLAYFVLPAAIVAGVLIAARSRRPRG